MKTKKRFWIKERHNPQTGVYYVAYGLLSLKEVKECEQALYGENIMHGFVTEKAYIARLKELKKQGERVHGFHD